VESGIHNIPAVVEDIPVVAVHSDMGPHSVILSPSRPTDIMAIIDWEFAASAPYASLYRVMEMLFRESASNGFGAV
jgi:aminoglycoside phosphotransferase (APT) family kinase protein